MRAFSCASCRRLAPFESNRCLHCAADHGFDWPNRDLVALRPGQPDWGLETVGTGQMRDRCANLASAQCNGLTDGDHALCFACSLTRKRPNDTDGTGLARFAEAEAAKRRLVFELLELGLPVERRHDTPDGPRGMAFDLLSSASEPVTTGHADGVVTIDLAEADDAHREAMRAQMAEPYRTVLGHLRHEIGHYYQPLIVPEASLDEMRALFGDEREDYAAALDRHYAEGTPADWHQHSVSAYATMHAWEEWAETFAHYLHIRDALQTAAAFGVRVDGPPDIAVADSAPLHSDARAADTTTAATLVDAWLPLTYALNALTRSMGEEDLYPFVLPPPVVDKLEFIHRMVGSAGSRPAYATSA